MTRLSVSFWHYLCIFFLFFWESSRFDPNWFHLNRPIFLKGLALIFCLPKTKLGKSLLFWSYLKRWITGRFSLAVPVASNCSCQFLVARSPMPWVHCDGVCGRRMSQSLFFSGELVEKAGHTSASPWAAAAELQHFVYEHMCCKEWDLLEAVGVPWNALVSFQGAAIPLASNLGGVTGYLPSFLAGNFPNLFQYFCCYSSLWARACRCMAQPGGLERWRSPAASSDGCGGCKPHPVGTAFCAVLSNWAVGRVLQRLKLSK